jgi:hypothetical protein
MGADEIAGALRSAGLPVETVRAAAPVLARPGRRA